MTSRLRDRNNIESTNIKKLAVTTTTPAMTTGESSNPGAPGRKHHNRPDHERDNAADADHSEGAEASAIIKPMPNRRSAAPA
jgi:hypothetical protein